jgi:predicted dehydrogenase
MGNLQLKAISGKPRVGIVGAGLMGYWHSQAALRAGVEWVGVADPTPPKAQKLASHAPGVQTYPSLEAMLDQARLDVVHLCTPPETHADLARMALNAGCHLLVEKPLAATAGETEELFGLASERGVILSPVHQLPFTDGVLKVRRANLGKLLHLGFSAYSAGGVGRSESETHQIMLDILPHPLSLMWALGLKSLAEISWSVKHPLPGELLAAGEVDGVSISIYISMNARPTRHECQVVGAQATAHLDLFHGYATIEPGAVSRMRKIILPFEASIRQLGAASMNLSQRAIRREPAYPGLWRLVRLFYDAVQGKSAPPITPEEALAIAKARDRLIQEIQ